MRSVPLFIVGIRKGILTKNSRGSIRGQAQWEPFGLGLGQEETSSSCEDSHEDRLEKGGRAALESAKRVKGRDTLVERNQLVKGFPSVPPAGYNSLAQILLSNANPHPPHRKIGGNF